MKRSILLMVTVIKFGGAEFNGVGPDAFVPLEEIMASSAETAKDADSNNCQLAASAAGKSMNCLAQEPMIEKARGVPGSDVTVDLTRDIETIKAIEFEVSQQLIIC